MPQTNKNEILVKDQNILGSEYGEAFFHCKQELYRVSSQWDRYETLFSTKTRVNILNEASGNFWHALQGVLFETVLLGLCRLTDPPSTMNHRNLSVRTLFELDPSKSKIRFQSRIDKANNDTKFARSWRDKRIAHNDYKQLTGSANKMEIATRLKVSKAIVSIHEVLRWVQGKYFDGDLFLLDLGDSDTNVLLSRLELGNEFRRRHIEELGNKVFPGQYSFEHKIFKEDYGRVKRYSAQGKGKKPVTPKKYKIF